MFKNPFARKPDNTATAFQEIILATSPVTGLYLVVRTWDAAHGEGPAEYFLRTADGTELNLCSLTGRYRFTESKAQALRWMTELTPAQIAALCR